MKTDFQIMIDVLHDLGVAPQTLQLKPNDDHVLPPGSEFGIQVGSVTDCFDAAKNYLGYETTGSFHSSTLAERLQAFENLKDTGKI